MLGAAEGTQGLPLCRGLTGLAWQQPLKHQHLGAMYNREGETGSVWRGAYSGSQGGLLGRRIGTRPAWLLRVLAVALLPPHAGASPWHFKGLVFYLVSLSSSEEDRLSPRLSTLVCSAQLLSVARQVEGSLDTSGLPRVLPPALLPCLPLARAESPPVLRSGENPRLLS